MKRSNGFRGKFIFAMFDDKWNIHVWCGDDGKERYFNYNNDGSLLFGKPAGGGLWARPRFDSLNMPECRDGRNCRQIVWPADEDSPFHLIVPGTTHMIGEELVLICAVDTSTRVIIVEIPPPQRSVDGFMVFWIDSEGFLCARSRWPVYVEGVPPPQQVTLPHNVGEPFPDSEGHLCARAERPSCFEDDTQPLVYRYLGRIRGGENFDYD